MTQKLSENFTRDETRCRCGECNKYSADIELIGVMQNLREFFNSPVITHSWFRCRKHNNRPTSQKNEFGVYGAGSNDNSWHLTGAAVDFHVQDTPNESVLWYIRDRFPDKYGVGIYEWGIHLDIRADRADWDETDSAKEAMYS